MRSAAPPLRGALIGCGFVSRFHLEAWSRVPDARLVALCDLDRDRLERAAERVIPEARMLHECGRSLRAGGGARLRRDLHASPSRIASWSSWRRGTGSHILCQKPAAMVRSDFTRDDRRLHYGRRPADDPRELAVPPVVSCPACGDRLGSDRPADPAADRPSRHAGLAPGRLCRPAVPDNDAGLILMDMGCHLVDTARYLMGEIQSVSATIGRFGRAMSAKTWRCWRSTSRAVPWIARL